MSRPGASPWEDILALFRILPSGLAPYGFNMVSGLEPFHNMGQAVKWALSPLSSGSKDHGTHNAPPFPRLEFHAFLVGENTML